MVAHGEDPAAALQANIEQAGGVWFKVEGLVAHGSRSVVRRASVNGSDDKIAIKVLPSTVDAKGTVLPREVLAMRMCEHPCVLSVKRVFYDTRRTFICMLLCKGGNVLDRTLETGGIAEEDAVIVIQDVLDALDHIHSRGLIHAAVEPSNIYLLSGDPMSPDFHHAVLGGFQRVKSQVLPVEETPDDLNYVSPELVLKFTKTVGILPAADMWSVGATLFTMLSGATPFHRRRNVDLQEAIRAGDVKFVSPYWDMTSRLAKDFISHLLVVDAKERLTIRQCCDHAWMQAALEINKRTTPAVLRAELTLRKLLIFKDVDEQCLHDLAKRVNFVKFNAGSWVARRGRDANSVFFVHSGSVTAYVEGRPIEFFKPGGFFGEAAFLDDRKHICDFMAGTSIRFTYHRRACARRRMRVCVASVANSGLMSL
jgi:calcium/calmodulin-dependent protein kinase I